jgi:hypothetical protein
MIGRYGEPLHGARAQKDQEPQHGRGHGYSNDERANDRCPPFVRVDWKGVRLHSSCQDRLQRLLESLKSFACNQLYKFGQDYRGRGAVLILVQAVHGHAKVSCLSG